MTSTAKALAAAALLAALLVASPVRPAAAATPCWKTLLNDWYDGRIDNVYPVHCYQDTLKHLPEDVSVYSSARDDILRALQSARAKLKASHKPAGANALVPAQTTGKTDTNSTGTTPGTTTPAGGGKGPGGTDAGGGSGKSGSPGRQPGKGLPGVAQQLNPSSPSSVPVPLLVLGGLALLLVAGGAVGLIVKRLQARPPGT